MLKNSLKIYALLQQQLKISSPLWLSSSCTRLSSSDTKTSAQWEKIYYGPLTSQIRAVKFFSLSSSVLGVIIQPVLYREITALDSVPLAVAAYSFVGFFTVATPILLHLITKKYVTGMEYDRANDVYLAKTYNFFCMPKELRFKIKDVQVPDVPGLFTSMTVKGKPMFLDPNQFTDTSHYAKMMGFDKPIDFKLYRDPVADNKK